MKVFLKRRSILLDFSRVVLCTNSNLKELNPKRWLLFMAPFDNTIRDWMLVSSENFKCLPWRRELRHLMYDSD